MLFLFYIFIFLLGIIFGSFIAAWVWRAHAEKSMWAGRSHCVACQYTLQASDLIPVASFLFLKGKCRSCETPISKHYFFTEIFTGVVFLGLAVFYGGSFFFLSPVFLFALLGSIFLIAIFVSDLLYQEIPFEMTLVPTILLFILALGLGLSPWQDMILGAIIAGGFFLLQCALSKGKWIGFGDVVLGILMGIILGWQGTLLALFLAYVGGALISVVLLLRKRADRKTPLPFGVFLTVATCIAFLWGEIIIDWYLSLL